MSDATTLDPPAAPAPPGSKSPPAPAASAPAVPSEAMRSAVRAVLEQAAAERQEWLLALVAGLIDDIEDREDAVMLAAIREAEAEGGGDVSREELFAILEGRA